MDLTPFGFPRRREVAIVLGAGATRGAHFIDGSTLSKPPLDTDFFTLLRGSALSSEDEVKKLLDFVEREFGDFNIRMENFYSQAHLHDQFEHDIPSGKKGRRRAYRWNLRYFRRVLPKVFGHALEGRDCNYHAKLAAAARPNDTFISFNYDCLLDRALARYAGRRWDPRYSYGFELLQPEGWFDHSGTGRFPKNPIQLLKPHGSLNWHESEKGVQLREAEYGERHEDDLTIVPPLWQKSFDQEPYRSIWIQTRQTLATVKALFVVGYSLPETDVYTQAALRIDVRDLDFLCVVNPDPDARHRLLDTLRGSLSTSSRVIELDRLSDLARLLPKAPQRSTEVP